MEETLKKNQAKKVALDRVCRSTQKIKAVLTIIDLSLGVGSINRLKILKTVDF